MRCPACTSSRLTAIQIRLAPDEDEPPALAARVRQLRQERLALDQV